MHFVDDHVAGTERVPAADAHVQAFPNTHAARDFAALDRPPQPPGELHERETQPAGAEPVERPSQGSSS
jgi:hypothetical protein